MGWASGNYIFDPVAQTLIASNAPDDLKTNVLEVLIGALQDSDWDTEGESLLTFADDPAIVAAFAANGVTLD